MKNDLCNDTFGLSIPYDMEGSYYRDQLNVWMANTRHASQANSVLGKGKQIMSTPSVSIYVCMKKAYFVCLLKIKGRIREFQRW